MGRATVDRLGTGPSTGSGPARRPRERHRRLSFGARRPAVPARPSSSPFPSRLRPGRLAAGLVAAALALLLAAGGAGAHDGTAGHVHLTDTGIGCDLADCPDAPTGFAAPGPKNGEITLHWSPASTGAAATSWNVTIAKSTVGTFIGTTLNDAGARSHTYKNLDVTETYNFLMRGLTGTGANERAGDFAEAYGVRPLNDTQAPAVTGAAVNGASLTVTFDEALDTGSTPAGTAFTVTETRAGASRIIRGTGTALISGTTARVSLARAVAYGWTVTVQYVKPGANPLQDFTGGNDVATFTGRTAVNEALPPQPQRAGALVDVMDGCTEAACPDAPTGYAEPGPGRGQITVKWQPATTGGIVAEWQLKTSTGGVTDLHYPALSDRSRTFSNLDPTKVYNIVVQGVGAGRTFGDAAVARNIRPADPPVFSSAAVNRTALTVTFDKALDTGSRPAGSAFTVTATQGGASRTLAGTGTARIAGAAVTVTLAGAVAAGETVTLAYAAPASNPLRNAAGYAVQNFTGQAVTNDTPAPGSTPTAPGVDPVPLELGLDRTCANCAHAPTGTAEPGPGYGEITLRWQPATTGPQGATEAWIIYADKQTTGNVRRQRARITNGQARSHTLTGLETGVTWTVGVERRRRDGINRVWSGDSAQARLQPLSVTVDAGDDVTVRAGARVALDGTGSSLRPGATPTYAWTQTAGPTVTLDDATSATPAFIAPSVSASTDLTFSLTVSDGTFSSTDTVTVTVLPSRVVSARVDGDELKVTFDAALDATSRPAGSAFTVTAVKPGSNRAIAGTAALVTISGSTVTAALSAAADGDETLTVSYDKPDSGAVLQDSGGAALESFANRTAGNAGDTTPPAFVSASINGTVLTVVFDEALDESVVPSEHQVGVIVDVGFGTPKAVSGISVSGSAVTLTLAAGDALSHGQTVEIRYTPSHMTALRDLSGNTVEGTTLGLWSATNVTPPAYSSASVDGATLTVTFDGGLDGASVPAASAFTVKATRSGTERTVDLADTDPVSISGSAVTLTLAEAVRPTPVDTVTVAYAAPDTGAKLQDADGANHPVPDFSAQAVMNDTPADTVAPVFVSASINGTVLTVVFDEALDESVPQHGPQAPFGIRTTTGAGGQSYSISGNTVTVIFSAAGGASHGETVTVDYFSPSPPANRFKDLSGNELANFSGKPATNVTPPAFSSASVDGAALTVTFDGGLDEGSVPAASAFTVKATRAGTERTVDLADTDPVSISGSAVTLTLAEAVRPTPVDTVTVAYTAPDTGAKLQDADGANHPVPDFSAQAVMNDTPADTVAPAFVSATINGTVLTVVFDEALAAAEATGDVSNNQLRVEHGGAQFRSTALAINGRTATATFAAADAPGHGVSVENVVYQASATAADRLADLSGNPIAVGATTRHAILGLTVTNVTPPAFSSASVDGAALTVTFDGGLDEGSVPAASAFTVKATRSGTERTVALADADPVSVSGTAVTLTLAEAVLAVDTVTVAYTEPAANPLQDADGANHPVPDFAAQTAANDTPADTVAPTLVSAVVNGTVLTVVFDEALDESVVPSEHQVGVIVDVGFGTPKAVSGISVSGSAVTLTLAAGDALSHGQTVEIRYTPSHMTALRDLSGNTVEGTALGLWSATNVTPPAYSSASVDGAALTVTFDGGLDGASVPAASAFTVKATRSGTERTVALADTDPVSVSGTAVTLTLAEAVWAAAFDTVTVAYAAPDTGAKLQDADGANHPVPDFSAQAVMNDTPADTVAPAFVSATINGTVLTVVFDEALAAAEATGDVSNNQLRVEHGGAQFRSTALAINGRTATATFAAADAPGHGVSVENVVYQASATAADRLADLSGNPIAVGATTRHAILGLTVTNVTPPAFSSASVDGAALTVTFDGGLDEGSVPAASAFTVKATRAGTERTVALADADPVAVSGTAVTLALAEAVLAVDTVTVAYTEPAANPLQDADGANHPVPDFAAQTAANDTPADTVAPTLVSAVVNGTVLTVVFDEALDESVVPSEHQVGVIVDVGFGTPKAVSGISVSGSAVTLTLAAGDALSHGQTVEIRYTPSHMTALRDLSGNTVEGTALGLWSATNVTPPAYSSASVDGAALTVTFDGGLDGASVPAASAFTVKATRSGTERTVALADADPVSVSGSAVTLTLAEAVWAAAFDTVTVAYAAPDTNPLRDADGANHPVPDFAAQTAANETPADTVAPTLVSATMNGAELTVVFDEALDESAVPATSRICVRRPAQGCAQATAVTVKGATVTATFAARSLHGEALEMSYIRPVDPATRLKDLTGNEAATTIGRGITNVTPPAFKVATVIGVHLIILFDGGLDADSVPAASAFTVTVDGTAVALATTSPVSVTGPTVTLTLAEAVLSIDPVTVAYAAPATNPLQDADGANHPVPDFAAQTAANITPSRAAPGAGSLVDVSDGCTDAACPDAATGYAEPGPGHGEIKVTWRPAASGGAVVEWNVKSTVDGVATTITGIPATDRMRTLSGLDPTKPHDIVVQGIGSGRTYGDAAVARGIRPLDAIAPAVLSASVNGAALTVTFDKALDTGSAPLGTAFTVVARPSDGSASRTIAGTGAAGIEGAAVTVALAVAVAAGETVTVSYTAPDANPLRDAAGNGVAGFAGEAVSNDTPAQPPDTADVPAVSSAWVKGTSLTVAFDEALDSGSAPAGSVFTVTATPGGGGTARTLAGTGTVAVSGTTARAVLAGAAAAGETVTVRYTAPAANPLRDADGNGVASFTGQAAANVTGDTTAPVATGASVSGTTLVVAFDEALDPGSPPPGRSFVVTATPPDDAARTLQGTGTALVEGAAVTVTLADAVVRGETVSVQYLKPASDPLRDRAGNAVASLGRAATNTTPDTAGPAFVSAAANGAAVTVTFDEALSESAAPAAAAFTVKADGTEAVLAAAGAVAVSGTEVTLTLAASLASGQAVTVSYDRTQAGAGALRDLALNEAASFADRTAANDTPGPAPKIAMVTIESEPLIDADEDGTAETYGRGDRIEVKVTWSSEVLWDLSAQGAAMAVRLDVGGTVRWAHLATGGAARGRARALMFRYTVVEADRDTDGIVLLRTAANDLVVLSGGASLKDAQDRDAARDTGAFGRAAGHLVDGGQTSGPAFVSATATGATLTVNFDIALAAPADPAATSQALRQAFIVQGGRHRGAPVVNQSPNRVTVGGTTVTLTLGTGIAPGQPVAVTYLKQAVEAGHRLKDKDGKEAAEFEGAPVVNATPGAASAPELARATVEGSTLTLIFDRALDEGSTPAGSRFRFGMFDLPEIPGTGTATVRGPTVVVTLAKAVPGGLSAWLNYLKGDDTSPLRGAGGGEEVADIVHRSILRLEKGPPVAVSGSVSGSEVTLYFDEALDTGSVPAAGAFAATVGGSTATLAAADPVAVKGTAVFLTLASAAGAGEKVTVTYAAPDSDPLQDTAGNKAGNFGPMELVNEGTVDPGKPVLAATEAAVANGDALTLAFDQALDPAAVPGNGAFLLSSEVYRGVHAVTVRGSRVEVRLAWPVQPCDHGVTVSYLKPGANALQNSRGTAVDGFAGVPVRNLQEAPGAGTPGCDRDALEGAVRNSIVLRAKRPFDTDRKPRAEWFTVEASGGPVTVTGAAFSADDPHELKLTLSRHFVADETVTVSYRRPLGAVGLWNVDGNQIGDVVDMPVKMRARDASPAVEAAALASDPGEDGTYAAGDTVRVKVTFGAAVDVDTAGGTPRLKLDLGGEKGSGERWAAYEGGTGTNALTFAWTVAAGDASAAGVAVLADTLELDGGAIASDGKDAALGHAGLDPDPAHRVDGVAPALTSAAVDGAVLTVIFDEALDAGAAPPAGAFTVTADGTAADLAETGAVALSGADVTLTLAAAVAPGAAVTVSYAPPAGEGAAPLRDLAGNAVAGFSDEAAANGTAAPAGVEAVALVSDPGADGAYAARDSIRVGLTFGAAVDVDAAGGTPRLQLDLGGDGDAGLRWAAYEGGAGTKVLTFAYAVVRGDRSAAGVAVRADTLEANGGSLAWVSTGAAVLAGAPAAGGGASGSAGTDAARVHEGLAPDPAHRVDTTAPLLTGITTLDGATLTLLFDEAMDTGAVPAADAFTVSNTAAAVSVTGVAFRDGDATRLELTVSPAVARPGPGSDGPGTAVVTYEPPAAKDAARLRDAAGNEAAVFRRAVTDIAAPRPAGATVSGTTLTVRFDRFLSKQAAHVPQAGDWTVEVNGAGRGVAGSALVLRTRTDVVLTLASAVAPGDAVTLGYDGTELRDIQGRAVAAFSGLGVNNPPSLVAAAVEGAALVLTFDVELDTGSVPAADAFTVKVDGTEAALAGTGAVALSGAEVTLALAAAPAADAAVTVGYAPPGAGAVRLRDAAGNAVEEFVDEAAANETAPPAVTGVEVTSDPGPDGVYAEGETIEATVRFSAAVRVPLDGGAVEGATLTVPPTLALIADTAAGDATLRRAVYASGSGTAALSFSWPVSKGTGRCARCGWRRRG